MKLQQYFGAGLLALLAACSQKDASIAQKFNLDESKSIVEWKGSAPTHFHKGSFKVTGTFLTDGSSHITGGEFSIPIASIDNEDLSGPPKTDLLNHLKSPDFFNLAVYPTATFRITKIDAFKDPATGANVKVTGNFTLIGQEHPLQIPAKVTVTKDRIYVESTFKLNRHTWGMSKYNDPAETLYILPDIDITLALQGIPSK